MLLAPRLRAGNPDHRANSGKASQYRFAGAAGEVPQQSRRNLFPDLRHRRSGPSRRSQRALKKAEELLKIKPGHHRALKVQEDFAGYGEGGAARIGLLKQFTQPWNEGGWIPWSVLAFGLAVFGVMAGVIIVWLGKTAIIIDTQVAGITVTANGESAVVTVPGMQMDQSRARRSDAYDQLRRPRDQNKNLHDQKGPDKDRHGFNP